MADRFGELLLEVANQAARAASAAESTLRRVDQVSREMSDLAQRVAKLEEAKEWNGEERRKVEERLGTGDHTFQKLLKEVDLLTKEVITANRTAGLAIKEVNAVKGMILKREDKKSSRRWEVLKIVLQAAVPLIVSGLGTALSLHYMAKGGSP